MIGGDLNSVDGLQVPLHVALLVKGSGAARTEVGLFPSVDTYVSFEVVLLVDTVEALAADVAGSEGGGGGGSSPALRLPPLQHKAALRPDHPLSSHTHREVSPNFLNNYPLASLLT